MSYIRKIGKHWQCLIRIKDHPQIIKSFKLKEDVNFWARST
jgi:hypothetical protein